MFITSSKIYFFTNILFCLFICNWRIVVLQRCVGFCCTTVWISHKYVYIPSILESPPMQPLWVVTECQPGFPMLYIAASHYLSVLHMVVCIVSDGQGGLACCSPRGWEELGTTERLNWVRKSVYMSVLLSVCSPFSFPCCVHKFVL